MVLPAKIVWIWTKKLLSARRELQFVEAINWICRKLSRNNTWEEMWLRVKRSWDVFFDRHQVGASRNINSPMSLLPEFRFHAIDAGLRKISRPGNERCVAKMVWKTITSIILTTTFFVKSSGVTNSCLTLCFLCDCFGLDACFWRNYVIVIRVHWFGKIFKFHGRIRSTGVNFPAFPAGLLLSFDSFNRDCFLIAHQRQMCEFFLYVLLEVFSIVKTDGSEML